MTTSAAARVRAAATRAVLDVEHGRALDQALKGPFETLPGGPDRALLQELAYGVVRWRRLLETVCQRLLSAPGRRVDERVRTLLLVGLYQLRFLRVPPYAAVMETVAAADCLDRGWAKPFVNALLRRFLREHDGHGDQGTTWAVRHSHPDWLVAALIDHWPQDCEAILRANNETAHMTLRVNLRKTRREDYSHRLAEAGIDAAISPYVASALSIAPRPAATIPGFADGAASVQDAGAQWVPDLLEASPGDHVLDACAAPGGKAAHIVERTPGLHRLTAVDIAGDRLALLSETMARLSLAHTVVPCCSDATLPGTWWDGTPFDRILLDAPCSGTGVIRRHPDIKWLRRPSDIARLAHLQYTLLRALWPTLKSGGTLLYATCSVLGTENAGVVAPFLGDTPDARERPFALPVGRACSVGWQILPGEGGMDGFYYARLDKKPR